MKTIERKAVRLVTAGKVRVNYWRIGQDGDLAYAQGEVQGDHDTYTVTVEPGHDTCNCEFGVNRTGVTHSHTAALRLAAWNEARKAGH